jgi:flagellar hook-associated protein 1 FlgK
MSLTQALATAVSGLRATQAGLSIVSSNVANAETPGYIRKTASLVTSSAGDAAIGVRVDAINRQLDQYVQRQLRVESSGASYADLRAQFYDRLQQVYGAPGSSTALDTLYGNFSTSLQALTVSPEDSAARSSVISSAQVLTQSLNSMTSDIQGMRSDAELGLSDSVTQANDAMTRIADINQQLGTMSDTDAATASLLDQRDTLIDQLSKLMDIKVVPTDHNRVSVFTNSGIQLVGAQASHLDFDAQGSMTPASQWNVDPTKRTAGTIMLVGPNGGNVDLIANKSIRSGQIAAYLEMRDQILPQAQAQLDQLAAGMASALSDQTTNGTPQTVGAQAGFDVDLSGLQDGNSVQLTYTDNTTNSQRTVTIVRVDDPSALPLPKTATANPNDQVIGLDFSGGAASIASQLNSALATSHLQFSNPAGTTLRVLDDGGLNKVDVNSLSATVTQTSLASGTSQLPFFTDASDFYTGKITSVGSQSVGLAGRIAVNPNLVIDPTRLVISQTSPLTASGDATRPNFIYGQLNATSLTYSPASGIGTTVAPFSGSLPTFLRQVLSQQGDAAQSADSLKQGQDVVLNSLQQRFDTSSAVNVDEEMANLISLQNSYAANARVLSTVQSMIDTLLKI